MAQVKICGLTTEPALTHAIQAGADLVGLVHFSKSPRHLELDAIAKLAAAAGNIGKVRTVVLLVNPDDALVVAVANKAAPDIIQLHGAETPERVAEICKISGLPILKALSVATPQDVSKAEAYLQPGCADQILFDAKPPPDATLPGGNGLTFDWTILDGIAARFPFALAGGLNPDNVAEAIRLTQAAIVDVSSGVEASPGKKDPELVERFIAAAKGKGQSAV
ncbi:MAG: phosphoribosylanthranilate isomerase [Alphaproteobacteria bacterium]|nr:phosphoribosylanthranilate isomerase [Alphaproteobacteria bacterium]